MLGARLGLARVIMFAVAAYTLFACTLFAVTALGSDSLAVLIGLLLATFGFLGLVIPSTMVLSLDDHGSIAGMASALGGTLQMVTGGIMIAVVSAFSDGTAMPMVSAIAGCAVGASILAFLTLRQPRAADAAE